MTKNIAKKVENKNLRNCAPLSTPNQYSNSAVTDDNSVELTCPVCGSHKIRTYVPPHREIIEEHQCLSKVMLECTVVVQWPISVFDILA
jgi:hypothetical protein